jgi:hypothetical protein
MNIIAEPCYTSKSKTFTESGDPSGVAALAATKPEGNPSGAAAGLVYSQTSGTSPQPIPVDAQKSRLKRLRCTVITAARLHVQQKSKWRVCMITPTYAPAHDWQPHQISGLIRHIRQWLKRRGIEMRFVWVQEFTKKGRPHYHLLLWLPLGITLPKPDKQGWWPWGMTKIEWARNAVGYIAKYASKGDSLHRPAEGARMHGNGGLTGDALNEARWWKLPGWARDEVQPSDCCKRRKGGGLFIPETGEILTSPWEVRFIGGKVYIVPIEGYIPKPRKFISDAAQRGSALVYRATA